MRTRDRLEFHRVVMADSGNVAKSPSGNADFFRLDRIRLSSDFALENRQSADTLNVNLVGFEGAISTNPVLAKCAKSTVIMGVLLFSASVQVVVAGFFRFRTASLAMRVRRERRGM